MTSRGGASPNAALAALAAAEAEKHPPRSPERRAAAEAWVALATTDTLDAARRVLWNCAEPKTRYDAGRLLRQLAEQDDTALETEGG